MKFKYNTRLTVEKLDGNPLVVDVDPDRLANAGGLKSGVTIPMQRVGSTDQILIRPYYRRFQANELNVFAVEVEEGAVNG